MYTHTGAVKGRWGRRFGESFHPMGLYQARRRRVDRVGAASRDQWDNFCITTDTVELMADDSLYAAGRAVRAGRRDRRRSSRPWLAARTADEAVAAFQEHRVPASTAARLRRGAARPSSSPPAATSQAAARPRARRVRCPAARSGIGDRAAAGRRRRRSVPTPRRSARRWPRPTDRRRCPRSTCGATRMLEFGIAWAGPLAARMLGDLGVDVVKVEHPLSRGFGTGGGTDDRLCRGAGASSAPPAIRAEIFPRRRAGRAAVEPHGHVEQDEPQQAQPVPRRQAGRGRGGARRADRRRRHRRAQLHAARRPRRSASTPSAWPSCNDRVSPRWR